MVENNKRRFRVRPQILTAILILGAIGITTIFVAPDHIDKVAIGVVTGIGMLGMKLLESEEK